MSEVDDGSKADGAMLAIGELANRIGVPTHVLRYWETRFPQLKPLQRSGRRRYYRAEDVALAERINELLHGRGFTVEGARKELAGAGSDGSSAPRTAPTRERLDSVGLPNKDESAAVRESKADPSVPVEALVDLRRRLSTAIERLG